MRIRQSHLGAFDKCPRSLQYDLEAPPDQYHSGIVRAVGTAYHAGLEYLYLKRVQSGPVRATLADIQDMATSALNDEIERAGNAFLWDDKFPTFEDARLAVSSMLAAYVNGGHAWPEDWEVLGVEERFELPGAVAGLHDLSGTIDLILQDPNGFVVGVDHKTCGRMWDQYKHLPRKQNQAPLYVAALRELYPEAPGHRFVFDVMSYKGKFERRICDPDDRHVDAVLAKALQVATVVDGCRKAGVDLPANPASNLCSPKYCDWFDVCPHGEALD